MYSTTKKFTDGQVFTIYEQYGTREMCKISFLELLKYHNQNKKHVMNYYKQHIKKSKALNFDYFEALIRHLCNLLAQYSQESPALNSNKIMVVSNYDESTVHFELILDEKTFKIHIESDNISYISIDYPNKDDLVQYITFSDSHCFTERIKCLYKNVNQIMNTDPIETVFPYDSSTSKTSTSDSAGTHFSL